MGSRRCVSADRPRVGQWRPRGVGPHGTWARRAPLDARAPQKRSRVRRRPSTSSSGTGSKTRCCSESFRLHVASVATRQLAVLAGHVPAPTRELGPPALKDRAGAPALPMELARWHRRHRRSAPVRPLLRCGRRAMRVEVRLRGCVQSGVGCCWRHRRRRRQRRPGRWRRVKCARRATERELVLRVCFAVVVRAIVRLRGCVQSDLSRCWRRRLCRRQNGSGAGVRSPARAETSNMASYRLSASSAASTSARSGAATASSRQSRYRVFKARCSSSDTSRAPTRRARRRARSGWRGRVGADEAPKTVAALALAPPPEPGGVGAGDSVGDGVGVGVGVADRATAEPVGAKRTMGPVRARSGWRGHVGAAGERP